MNRWIGIKVLIALISLAALAEELPGHENHATLRNAFGGIMVRMSADGESLAFSYQGAIWRMARQGGSMRRLTDGPGFDIEPAWSPDGKQIAFIRSKGFSVGRLELIDAQTGSAVDLPSGIQVSGNIAFDRLGRQVFGLFQLAGQRPRMAWYELQTGKVVDAIAAESWPVTPIGTPGFQVPRFALSPDNQFVAITATADVPGEQSGNQGPQNEIWQVSLSGQPPKRLTTWPARVHELCWRPDSQALILSTERGGVHNDLWELPLSDPQRGPRKLTFGQADEGSADCARGGRWMCYTDNRHGPTMFVVRDLESEHESLVALDELDYGTAKGKLRLQIAEPDAAEGTTARIVLRHENGKFHAPPGSLYRLLGSDLHFYLHGEKTFDLPVGSYSVKAGRGPEHKLCEQSFEVRQGETTETLLQLERWTNQRTQGWVSGENHIHANYGYGHWYNSPATMRLQCAGEDLTIANFMVANSDGDGVFDREFFLGRPDPLSSEQTILYWNEEFRSTIWGHMTLLNLKSLVTPIFTGFKFTTHPHDTPTNADIADHVHDQDGVVNYTHPAHNLQDPYASAYSAKEMPVDVALGKVDSMDVMGANQYANMAVWYRLLNCGLRVPASAGTDCFLNRIASRLPGSDRVYVHCSDRFTYQEWTDNLKRGRTFVTNGPMLRFTVDGHEAGSMINLEKTSNVSIVAEATAQFPLESMELIINGESHSLAKASAGDGQREFRAERSIELTLSSWLALRVKGQRGPHQAASEAFAHTSPVYVTVAGAKIQSRIDAEYFVTWIERLREQVRKRNQIPPSRWEHVEEQLARALDFYRAQASTISLNPSVIRP